MILRTSVITANAMLVVASLLLLFPASVFAVEALASHCVSSMDRAERSMIVWAVAATLATPAVVRGLARANGVRVAASLALQLAVVAAAAIALPNLDFGSLDRSRQKRTVADMRTIAREIHALRGGSGRYPDVQSVAQLRRLTTRNLPVTDAWGTPFLLQSGPNGYTLMSYGLCGQRDARRTFTPYDDIVVANGEFVQTPWISCP
jgi:hypothetical protein